VHQLEHIRLRVLAPANLDLVGDLAEALLEARRVAGVRPQHPRIWRLLSGAVAVLDGELRLSALALAVSADRRFPRLDSPYSAEAHQRDARCWRSASFADLVERRATVDKV
jgi:hypothetical protein